MEQLIGIGTCMEPDKRVVFFFTSLSVVAYGINNLMDGNRVKVRLDHSVLRCLRRPHQWPG